MLLTAVSYFYINPVFIIRIYTLRLNKHILKGACALFLGVKYGMGKINLCESSHFIEIN